MKAGTGIGTALALGLAVGWAGLGAGEAGGAATAAGDRPAEAAARSAVAEDAARAGFELRSTRVRPKRPLFDGPRRTRLEYGYGADRPLSLRIRLIHAGSRNTVGVWRRPNAPTGRRLRQAWDGLNRRGKAAPDGRYEFRVGPAGGRDRFAGRFRFRGHVHPVDGPRGSRGGTGEFGAPRNGGRRHEGYDVLAPCGTPLVAARGGRVKSVGFDPRLYGWFVRINARKSRESYFYSHLVAEPEVRRGDRVHTGQRVGRVGQTGNAASTPCHLHFELRVDGRLVDPKPHLRRWAR